MDNLRFEKGKKMLYKVDGKGGEEVINSLKDIAPDLGKYIIEFAFGDIYTRGEMCIRDSILPIPTDFPMMITIQLPMILLFLLLMR